MRAGAGRFAILTVGNGAAACLMIAAVSLLSVEAIGPLHALLLAGAILHGRWRGGRATVPRLWDLLALGALVFFPFDLFILSRSLIGAALRLLTFVVAFRCANLSGQRELRQAIALSFVQMVAAAASTTEVRFSVLLAAYLAMAIWTLMAIASARDDAPAAARGAPSGRPVLVMTASTLAAGSILFFAIPHLGTGYFHPTSLVRPPGDALAGFADRIELGSISRIKKRRTIVMRAKVASAEGSYPGLIDPASMTLRWRGVALDTFDGRSWSVARPDREWIKPGPDGSFALGGSPPAGQGMIEQEITLNPSMAPVLFVLPGAVRIVSEGIASVGVDAGGSIVLPAPRMRRFTYHVLSPDPEETTRRPGDGQSTEGLADRERYLTLPRPDPRVAELARRVTSPADSDFEKARRIEDYLRTSHAYTLDVNDAGVADPVAHFLLEGNPGHCEYFSTSMAVMLRHLGIASRVVNGFASGEWSNLTGGFVVRESDAHSWVEAWIPQRGWITFDPTPTSREIVARAGLLARFGHAFDRIELMWDTWVIGLDLLDQRSLASSLYDVGAAIAGAARRGISPLGSGPRWGAVLLALALTLLAARRLRWPRGLRWPRFGGGAVTEEGHPLSEAWRRFEARWAARGFRRPPGQTPLEFARDLERVAIEPSGTALAFVEGYYRSRFGG
ncbi:MAG TPA: DUF3488 and transglutaminase-like domain-containing protein [Candidatus Polarisedimenticolia bacterium]|jgi:transglutaminase-like putative cysteine protease